ncbi:hypothetical protein MGN70_002946 [Eutypa lata]|nr:hypothetical protein MGN70_002946 [Eutypa lata]
MASAANSSTGSNTASELIAPFLKAWGSSAPEELIACYADHGLEYSDYAAHKLNMDKKAAVAFIRETFEEYSLVNYKAVSEHGTRDLCTLEVAFTLLAKKDTPFNKKGDILELPGVSLFKFDQDGKIVVQHDYYCIPIPQ